MVVMPNLWIIFLTGLFTGGLTCMAVQGGLLTAVLSKQEEAEPFQSRAGSILAFLLAKLFAYTLLGALLGWLGSFFTLTIGVQALLMTAAAVFMIGSGLSLLDVHPVFRLFVIQPPYALRRFIRTQTKADHVFAPAALGALTVFIPCGTTQAMMALAVASQNPWAGAAILATFTAGTSPLFFLLGYSIDKLKEVLRANFAPILAAVVISMGLWNINNALVLAGASWAPIRLLSGAYCTVTFCETSRRIAQATDTVTIRFEENGYVVDNPYLRAGMPITLNLVNIRGRGCIQAFSLPRYNIQRIVPVGSTDTVRFVAPNEEGEIAFSCGMGMFSGTLYVTKQG